MPSVTITLINYYFFDLGDDSFHLPYPLMYEWNTFWFLSHHFRMISSFRTFNPSRLPFNWRTPFGYSIAILLEWAAVLSITYSILPIMCFAIGSFYLATSFIQSITASDFRILEEKISNGMHLGLSGQFCSFMQEFSTIKQLSLFTYIFHIFSHFIH